MKCICHSYYFFAGFVGGACVSGRCVSQGVGFVVFCFGRVELKKKLILNTIVCVSKYLCHPSIFPRPVAVRSINCEHISVNEW